MELRVPWSSTKSLPESVKTALSSEKERRVFLAAANDALENGKDETTAIKIGYGAANRVKKADPDASYVAALDHKISQRAANYRPLSDTEHSCATCQYFIPEWKTCLLIAGTIEPDYVSDLYQPLSGGEMPSGIPFYQSFEVQKSDSYEQNVFGWANVSELTVGKGQVVDSQGDVIDAVDLENAAYNFVLDFRDSGEMHSGMAKGRLIESMVFTPEKVEALKKTGVDIQNAPTGWWVGFHVEDEDVFAKVVDGTYPMFSIQGVAVPEEVEVSA